MGTKYTFQEVVVHFGSKSEIARILGISPQAVNNWGERIPPGAAIRLEKHSEGKIRAIDMPVNLGDTDAA